MRPNLSRRSTAALAAAIAVTAATPAVASASSPLAAWWPLAEGRGQLVRDLSGNRNHGTLGATSQVDEHDPAWIRGGRWGWALEFDGDDYVQVPESGDFDLQEMTVSVWFKGSQSPGTHRYLISKGGDGCVSASWALQTSWNGGLWFQLWNGSQQIWSGGADSNVWDGRWHHAAGTWDGQRPRLYVDGRLVAGGSVSNETIEYDLDRQDATLGAYRADCELMFAGALDQVMIWKKPIEVDRIWKRWGWFLGSPNSG
jgi:hypothetical protein